MATEPTNEEHNIETAHKTRRDPLNVRLQKAVRKIPTRLKHTGLDLITKLRNRRAALAHGASDHDHHHGFFTEFPFVFKGLLSQDRPTRWASMLFMTAFLGTIGIMSFGTGQYIREQSQFRRMKAAQIQEKKAETTRMEKDLDHRRESMVFLGKFKLQLAGDIPYESKKSGTLNLAEVEVILFCDNPETQSWMNENLIQVKNQVNLVLTAVDRDEVMSRKGKQRLTRMIMRQINQWLPHGKVQEVYFSRFAIG